MPMKNNICIHTNSHPILGLAFSDIDQLTTHIHSLILMYTNK